MAFDIYFVGGGPIGLTMACLLRLTTGKNICVFEKREKPQRNHGLKINADSVYQVQELLKRFLENNKSKSSDVEKLQKIFSKWSGNFIRTATIESDLGEIAHELGIQILRNKKVTKENFETFFPKDAKIIIGTDGSHSIVREATRNKKVDEKTLRHLVEFKYQSSGLTRPRGYSEAATDVLKHGRLNFENMSKAQTEKNKPVTLHIFVNKGLFNKLRYEDEKGNMKAVFGNHLTLPEIEKLAKEDPEIKSLYEELQNNIRRVKSRGGDCIDEQITTLEMKVYRSEKIVKQHEGRYYILGGDAAAGIILERGFNTGLKGCALICEALQKFFSENKNELEENPLEFEKLEERYIALFKKEVKKAENKNIALGAVESGVMTSNIGIETSSESLTLSNKLIDKIGSFFKISGKNKEET